MMSRTTKTLFRKTVTPVLLKQISQQQKVVTSIKVLPLKSNIVIVLLHYFEADLCGKHYSK